MFVKQVIWLFEKHVQGKKNTGKNQRHNLLFRY